MSKNAETFLIQRFLSSENPANFSYLLSFPSCGPPNLFFLPLQQIEKTKSTGKTREIIHMALVTQKK